MGSRGAKKPAANQRQTSSNGALRTEGRLSTTKQLKQQGHSGSKSEAEDDLSSHFTAVEILFQLATEKRRDGLLYPRDIGTLLLWSLPCAVPLVEGPRIFFLKNRSSLRDVIVLYVNGWTHDDMIPTPVSSVEVLPKSKDGGKGRTSNAQKSTRKHPRSGQDPDAPQEMSQNQMWVERIGASMLAPIRQRRCWAREGCGVQFAPLLLSRGKSVVERDIFWRYGSSRSRNGRESHCMDTNKLPAGNKSKDSTGSRASRRQVNRSDRVPNGVGALFSRALQINNSSTKDGSNAAAESPSSATPSSFAKPLDATPSLESLRVLSQPADGQPSLWSDNALLEGLALSLERDRAVLEGLGFIVEVPPDSSPTEWSCFDKSVLPREENGCEDGSRQPRVFALDCEMVLTTNSVSSLARVSLVDVCSGTLVLDTLVKPLEEVIDHVTRYSGVDEKMLEGVETTLADAQLALKRFIDTETFLVGHSLENDLRACKLLPNCRILDTTYLFPHHLGLPRKHSLRFLSLHYLNKRIQQGAHDSTEDACVSAELVHLKLQHGPDFGVNTKVSVLKLMGEASTGDANEESVGKSSSLPVELHLFDDACSLSEIVPSETLDRAGGVINVVPVRNDRDAVRKTVRHLQQRRSVEKDVESGLPLSFALTWLQLSENVVRSGAEVAEEDEERPWFERQMERVEETNRHVMKVIQAAPHNSLIIVVAGGSARCIGRDAGDSKEEGHEASSTDGPRGACFAFVKDDNMPGPSDAWLEGEAVEFTGAVDQPGDTLANIPACEQQ